MDEIVEALEALADEDIRRAGERFFKESVRMYGIKTAEVRRIAKETFPAGQPKEAVFALCERLWASGYSEQAYIAADWAYRLRKRYEAEDMLVFERWVERYVTNWATCDTLCNHAVGELVEQFPELVGTLKRWALSPNRWMRRAAAVSLIIPARHGLFLNEILEIAATLLEDADEMVQKGYGWMLKAASLSEAFVKVPPEVRAEHMDAVLDFVIGHRAVMPRTSLRYAVEKYPASLRELAMRRG